MRHSRARRGAGRFWLASLALHAAVLAWLAVPHPSLVPPPAELEIDLEFQVDPPPPPPEPAIPPSQPPAPPEPQLPVPEPLPPEPLPAEPEPIEPPAPVVPQPPSPPPPAPRPRAPRPTPIAARPTVAPPAAAPAPPAPAPPAPAPRPAATPDADAYPARLVAWLRRFETYPEAARRQGRSGLVHLRLRVDHTGRILGHEVLAAEGGQDFVAATERMLRAANPLPPPPGLAQGAETLLELRLPYRLTP